MNPAPQPGTCQSERLELEVVAASVSRSFRPPCPSCHCLACIWDPSTYWEMYLKDELGSLHFYKKKHGLQSAPLEKAGERRGEAMGNSAVFGLYLKLYGCLLGFGPDAAWHHQPAGSSP